MANLTSLNLENIPENPGVYIILVKTIGKPKDIVISDTERLIVKANWPALTQYVINRVSRIGNINVCPVIYIGAAPTSLKSRYRDLCGLRHTAFFPIFALLYGDWELELRWLETSSKQESRNAEKQLKEEYKQIHGRLPGLVKL